MADAYLAVVNPAAGGGRCGKQFPEALARLTSAGIGVDVVQTHAPGEAIEIARKAWADGRRRFIAVGGDGTGFEVVNGLFPAAGHGGERPRLGFLPMGTGNSFLRDFTENGAEHSIQAILDDRTRRCDVARLHHRTASGPAVMHWINILSIGFVADVNGLRARRFKAWGELGYVAAVVTAVASLTSRAYPLRCDAELLDDKPMVFASFNNSKYTGGKMMMAPNADTADGLIDFIRVGPLGRFGLLATFPKIFSGAHLKHPSVTESRHRTIDFQGVGEIDVMIDGEAEKVVPLAIDVLPGALDVCV
ncbi:MAG: YegS/Rv2252/BmrU family lipid kinase [Deltaproteobacteria bacterium]|nr:YegS/Rv2252/BmrU family lipid kinase [Nannocystaceae bacterium]